MALAMQAGPAPELEPAIPRLPRQDGVWQPRMRPNAAEVMELPGLRNRRERMSASTIEAVDRSALAAVKPSARMLAEVKRLSDPSFDAREQASRALLDRSIADAEVWALLDRGELDDEAHARLLTVAVRRVMEKPRGALGVRMGNAPLPRAGVLVQSTLPGMPADKVLLPNDLIETLDGKPLSETTDLVDALQQLAPGAEIQLVVVRAERDAQGRPLAGPDGKPVERRLEFKIPLGNANDLDKVDPGMPRGMGGGMNMINDQRRLQAEVVRARFERPLPKAVPVPPMGGAAAPSGPTP